MSVNIRSTDKKGISQPGSFSLAVAQTFLEQPTIRDNFSTYLFLSSNLKGQTEQPLSYWNPEDTESLSKIELLLLTQGWRRYSLEVFNQPDNLPRYPMEQSLILSGKVENINKQKAKSVELQAILRQDSLKQFITCPLDGQNVSAYRESLLKEQRKSCSQPPTRMGKPIRSNLMIRFRFHR